MSKLSGPESARKVGVSPIEYSLEAMAAARDFDLLYGPGGAPPIDLELALRRSREAMLRRLGCEDPAGARLSAVLSFAMERRVREACSSSLVALKTGFEP